MLVRKIGEPRVRNMLDKYKATALLDDDILSWEPCKYGMALDQGMLSFVHADMYELELNRRFDVILVWEAALMVVADNRQDQFAAMLKRHLSDRGLIVITGIRTSQPFFPHELVILGRQLADQGFSVTTGNMRFQPAPWAFQSIQEKWCPVLVAQASSAEGGQNS